MPDNVTSEASEANDINEFPESLTVWFRLQGNWSLRLMKGNKKIYGVLKITYGLSK